MRRKASSREKTLRMSITFFIVVAVSLVYWLPTFVMFTVIEFCSCFSPLAVGFVTLLLCANSLVNPFVYSFRMPIFQDTLRKFWRKPQQTIELRAISKKPHCTECNLWVMAWWPNGYCLRVRSFWAPAIVGDVFLGRWKFCTANLMVVSILRYIIVCNSEGVGIPIIPRTQIWSSAWWPVIQFGLRLNVPTLTFWCSAVLNSVW